MPMHWVPHHLLSLVNVNIRLSVTCQTQAIPNCMCTALIISCNKYFPANEECTSFMNVFFHICCIRGHLPKHNIASTNCMRFKNLRGVSQQSFWTCEQNDRHASYFSSNASSYHALMHRRYESYKEGWRFRASIT